MALKIWTYAEDYGYEPWSGAVDAWEVVCDNGLVEEFFQYVEDVMGEFVTETEINDILWFESEGVFEALGIAVEDEDEDEEDGDE